MSTTIFLTFDQHIHDLFPGSKGHTTIFKECSSTYFYQIIKSLFKEKKPIHSKHVTNLHLLKYDGILN